MLKDQDLLAIQEARRKVELAYAAWERYRDFTQAQVDAIIERAAAAATAQARRLAEMAVEETGYGNVKDKTAKNLLNSYFLPRKMRGMRTIGVLRELPEEGIVEIAVPMGVVAAIVPVTNPTSTVIFKTLISLKAGNAVVLSPHPRAKRCSAYTAELLHKAAVEAGAPEGLIQCLENPTPEATQELMRHPKTAIILATGGQGLVRAAYSSGKPALGVGPGNVPVLIDDTADLERAVAMVVEGKAFDYGTVCSSEQVLVAFSGLRERILGALRHQRAYICTPEQGEALARLLFTERGTVRPECVGQSPQRLAQMAGFQVPEDASILAVEIDAVGPEHPLSREKLSPVLALRFVSNFEEGLKACEAVLQAGGLGHTCVIFSKDEARIREFARRMPAHRVLVNTPAPHGSVGLTTNVFPSMTLGCGPIAANATGDNVGPQHLFTIKRLAYYVRAAEEVLPSWEAIERSELARAGEPALVGGVAQPATLPESLIEAVVERYLRRRGLLEQPSPQPTQQDKLSPQAVEKIAAEIVSQFLASRRPVREPSGTCPMASAQAPTSPPTSAGSEAAPAKGEQAPEPEIQIVDFVCEEDVRRAIAEKRKIYIGPRTIVTPAARELAARGDILVLAKRS